MNLNLSGTVCPSLCQEPLEPKPLVPNPLDPVPLFPLSSLKLLGLEVGLLKSLLLEVEPFELPLSHEVPFVEPLLEPLEKPLDDEELGELPLAERILDPFEEASGLDL